MSDYIYIYIDSVHNTLAILTIAEKCWKNFWRTTTNVKMSWKTCIDMPCGTLPKRITASFFGSLDTNDDVLSVGSPYNGCGKRGNLFFSEAHWSPFVPVDSFTTSASTCVMYTYSIRKKAYFERIFIKSDGGRQRVYAINAKDVCDLFWGFDDRIAFAYTIYNLQ